MSIAHFSSTIGAQSASGPAPWSPVVDGQVEADGDLVYALDTDFAISPSSASASDIAAIWVIQTSDNCYIRCGRSAVNSDNWYDDLGAAQGDPGTYTGTGTTVFTLGEQCDTVNIYNKQDDTVSGSPTFGNPFTGYTSDDKVTFFAPTQDAKYGRRVISNAFQSGFGSDTEDGNFHIQFTFRKSGQTDYTITFIGRARAVATVDL